MFNHKGTTLIESLLAFSIYITVIVMFVSLMTTLNTSSLKMAAKTQDYDEAVSIKKGDDPQFLIREVLP